MAGLSGSGPAVSLLWWREIKPVSNTSVPERAESDKLLRKERFVFGPASQVRIKAVCSFDQAAVAITPGRDFGSFRADKFVRFAYTTDLERLKLGVERIAAFLA